jgi:hypothetical protein
MGFHSVINLYRLPKRLSIQSYIPLLRSARNFKPAPSSNYYIFLRLGRLSPMLSPQLCSSFCSPKHRFFPLLPARVPLVQSLVHPICPRQMAFHSILSPLESCIFLCVPEPYLRKNQMEPFLLHSILNPIGAFITIRVVSAENFTNACTCTCSLYLSCSQHF